MFPYTGQTLTEHIPVSGSPHNVFTQAVQHVSGATIKAYDSVQSDVEALAAKGSKLWVSDACSFGLVSNVPEAQLKIERTPACLHKATKNAVELEGAKEAHIRDGAALCGFLAWLETRAFEERNEWDEVDAADRLEEFRLYVGAQILLCACVCAFLCARISFADTCLEPFPHAHTHAHIKADNHCPARNHSFARPRPRTHTHTRSHIHIHTHTYTHTRSHLIIHTLSHFCC